jgi:transcriptional regulator with XRE-family HTH domain
METSFQKKPIRQPADSSIGHRLKKIRLKKKIGLERAESETKVRSRYLEAIETNNFDLLPPSHSKGFVRRYARYLGLPDEFIERELTSITQKKATKQPFAYRPLESRSNWSITTRGIAVALTLFVFIGFIGYIAYQVKQFSAPPHLDITQPMDEAVVTTDTLEIRGKTDISASVFVDNLQATIGSDGQFTAVINLRPGLNQLTIRSENRIRKQTIKTVSILYQPPEPIPTPTPAPTPVPTTLPTSLPSASPTP